MKKTVFLILSLTFLLGLFSVLQAQSADLLWTEDFGATAPDGWKVITPTWTNNWILTSEGYGYNDSTHKMLYDTSGGYDGNSWAFTPGIYMTAGNEYYLTFYQRVYFASYGHNLKVTVGNAQTVESQNTTLLTLTGVTNTDYTQRTTAHFIPTSSGTYYFAFHCYSPTDSYSLFVDYVQAWEIVNPSGPDEPVPVELSSFTAAVSADNIVNLMWVTQSETGVLGFYVLRNTENHLGSALTVSELIPATNTSEQQSYIFKDSEIHEDGLYYYWLQNSDFNGATQIHGPVSIQFTTNENSTPEIPLVTQLNPVYPNPFNPMAFIPFSLKEAATVNFEIYNARGQLMKRIPLGQKAAGNHRIEWDGNDDQGHPCGTGIYQIRMTAGSESFSRKAVLMK
jgi:hypothetical protein